MAYIYVVHEVETITEEEYPPHSIYHGHFNEENNAKEYTEEHKGLVYRRYTFKITPSIIHMDFKVWHGGDRHYTRKAYRET